MRSPRAPASSNTWMYVAGGIAAVAVLVIVGAVVVMAVVSAGKTTPAPNVEQNFVDALERKPCALPATCTKQREGLVTYPVCTKDAPMGALEPGDYLLVKKNGRAYAGYVSSPSADGKHFVVTQFIGNEADDVTAADVWRLCR